MNRIIQTLALSLLALPVFAAPFAYISLSAPSNRSVQVMDLQTMSVVRTITGVGDEPSRMVISPDYNRIYLASYLLPSVGIPARGMIYAIDTTTRTVVGQVAVGIKQNRAIGISPDGSRLYSWKLISNGTPSIGLAVINSADLTEITTVPLPDSCIQNSTDIAVHQDGRVYLSGCNDGLYVVHPSTLTASLFTQVQISGSVIVGFSPDGSEIYMPALNSTVRAYNLSTSVANDFVFNLPSGSPAITGTVHRMVISKRFNSSLGSEPVFFTFFNAANGNLAIAHARRSELAPPVGTPLRRWVGTTAIGGASDLIGLDTISEFGLTGRLNEISKQQLSTNGAVITPIGSNQALAGVWRKTDIVFTDELLRGGFE